MIPVDEGLIALSHGKYRSLQLVFPTDREVRFAQSGHEILEAQLQEIVAVDREPFFNADVLKREEHARDLLVFAHVFVYEKGIESLLDLAADFRCKIALRDHGRLVLLIGIEDGSEAFDGRSHCGGRKDVCGGGVGIRGIDFLDA